MFNLNDTITDGTQVATVLGVTDAFVIAKGDGAEFVLNAAQVGGWRKVEATAATAGFDIKHPYGLYRKDGTRVDGYADLARAIRRGKHFFPKNGFVIVDATTATATTYAGTRG